MADYYELLGVSRQATAEEIKKAYRRLARQLHPDANPGDSAAEERFKQVAKAYEVLGDPQARARYDRFGESGVTGGGGTGDAFGGGLGDLFDAFFGGSNPFGGGGRASAGGPPRGHDLEAIVNISLEQAVFGSTVPVQVRTAATCDECHGSGAGHGTQPVTCSDCNGRGQIQRMRQSLLGQMVTATMCPRCNGHGKVVVTPCPACNGEGRQSRETTYQVDVPAGVDTGSTLRLTGRGAVGPRGGGVEIAVGDVVELVGPDRPVGQAVVQLLSQSPRIVDEMVGTGKRGGVDFNQSGAQGADRLLLLLGLGSGNDDDDGMAQRRPDQSQADACVAGGAFHDRSAGLQRAGSAGRLDDRQSRPILDRAAGVQKLGLAQDLAAGFFGGPLQPDQGGIADG